MIDMDCFLHNTTLSMSDVTILEEICMVIQNREEKNGWETYDNHSVTQKWLSNKLKG